VALYLELVDTVTTVFVYKPAEMTTRALNTECETYRKGTIYSSLCILEFCYCCVRATLG
jgi:hypothetical protein